MGAHDAVTIIKDMDYRGAKEEWSNTYMLDGTTPTTPTEWKALYDAIIASEKTCYVPDVRVIRAYGYVAGTDNAVDSYDYLANNQTVAGTHVKQSTEPKWAGDQAGWLRMRAGTNVNGKPKYLRKYFHGGASQTSNSDAVTVALKNAYVGHGTLMTGGNLPGGMQWIAPGGTVGTLPAASPYVTTRTLKRRGRRPTSAP